MSFLRRHSRLLGFIALMVVSVWGVSSGVVEENILALIPRAIKKEVSLFEHSPLSQKLIVIAQAPSAEQARETARELQYALVQADFIVSKSPADEMKIPGMISALPGLFSPQIEQETEAKISASAFAKQLARYYEELFSFQSILAVRQMKEDPFNLSEIIFNKWAQIGQGVRTLNYTDGFLANRDGTLLAGLYDAKTAVSDIASARRLEQFFTDYGKTLPPGVRVFFMGGMRYTLENVRLIQRDLTVVTLAGLICLTGVFVVFFRTRRALWVYLLPLLVLPPAAWATQCVFGHISGITLGFGSVVVGLVVDYAIYIYFALQQNSLDGAATVSKISKHLWCNFLTSGLCFIALLFSSVEVFKQIAVFALVALSLAFCISVWVLPSYFQMPRNACPKKIEIKVISLSWKGAVSASILLILFGFWGFFHLRLNADLDALNSTSATFIKDKQIAEELFPSDNGALLFSLGQTPEKALETNEQLSARLPKGLPVSALFVSERARTQNLNRWKNFWTSDRLKNTQLLLEKEAQKKGFSPRAFDGFWTWLKNSSGEPGIDFSDWYNPVVPVPDALYAVVNVVPNQPFYANLSDGIRTIFISAAALRVGLVQGVKKESVRVVLLAFLFNLLAVSLLFRNIKETLFCFVPVVLGGCFLFGCLALCKVEVNLFGLVFLPLLIGLGLDYAIFQRMKLRANSQAVAQLYSAQALLAAGLSTLAGFGVLVLAKHAVLFMMGACALVGIGGTVLVSVFILPALWRHFV